MRASSCRRHVPDRSPHPVTGGLLTLVGAVALATLGTRTGHAQEAVPDAEDAQGEPGVATCNLGDYADAASTATWVVGDEGRYEPKVLFAPVVDPSLDWYVCATVNFEGGYDRRCDGPLALSPWETNEVAVPRLEDVLVLPGQSDFLSSLEVEMLGLDPATGEMAVWIPAPSISAVFSEGLQEAVIMDSEEARVIAPDGAYTEQGREWLASAGLAEQHPVGGPTTGADPEFDDTLGAVRVRAMVVPLVRME